MINEQAANAFKTAKILTALYTRLDLARDCITIALDNLPKNFDLEQTKRINQIRNILSGEMSNIWDLREAEERRSCEQPDPTPAPPDETFPQFYRGSKWLDEDAFVQFDSKDSPCRLFKNDGSWSSDISFKFDEIAENILKFGWVQLTETEAMARIKPKPQIPGPTPAEEQFPPLADPDSLPDPPVLAGPDDNTPNFIQINLPNFF